MITCLALLVRRGSECLLIASRDQRQLQKKDSVLSLSYWNRSSERGASNVHEQPSSLCHWKKYKFLRRPFQKAGTLKYNISQAFVLKQNLVTLSPFWPFDKWPTMVQKTQEMVGIWASFTSDRNPNRLCPWFLQGMNAWWIKITFLLLVNAGILADLFCNCCLWLS